MLKFIVGGKEITEDDAKMIYRNEDAIKDLTKELDELHGGKEVSIVIED